MASPPQLRWSSPIAGVQCPLIVLHKFTTEFAKTRSATSSRFCDAAGFAVRRVTPTDGCPAPSITRSSIELH
jgi:hypothetical protein